MLKSLKKLFFIKNENLNENKNLRDKFSQIYANNIFGGKDSRSGEGSNMKQTAEIRHELPKLIEELGITSFMDAPCGDFFWMKETPLGVEHYIGIDIVDTLIEDNLRQFGNSSTNFLCLNLAESDLPKTDLIFCRDCLVHLTFEDANKIISNFKRSGAKYLLTTTFTERTSNTDLVGSDIWRPLNLRLAPFNFPKPLRLIDEKCSEYHGKFSDKHLGLWLLDEIIP
ncbi:MAG: hypothetical protein PHE17_16860 [Thiothrix sp.]|uniref:hypothetical protein n=1 Tax=Thiothrix sp. TaxID=1032 RepID=UPI0026183131|nr:hypothetical protein [Thiothrix sp.]MDD5394688.1 hypothetical protein [Thiothrix sp.]